MALEIAVTICFLNISFSDMFVFNTCCLSSLDNLVSLDSRTIKQIVSLVVEVTKFKCKISVDYIYAAAINVKIKNFYLEYASIAKQSHTKFATMEQAYLVQPSVLIVSIDMRFND